MWQSSLLPKNKDQTFILWNLDFGLITLCATKWQKERKAPCDFPFLNLQCCTFKENGKTVTEYDGNIDGWRGGSDFIGSYITHYFYKQSICWGSWPQIVLKISLAICLTAVRSQIDCLHYFWKLKILSRIFLRIETTCFVMAFFQSLMPC